MCLLTFTGFGSSPFSLRLLRLLQIHNPYGELLFQKVTQVGMPEWSYLVYIFAKAFILPVVVMLVVHLLYGKSSETWLIKEGK